MENIAFIITLALILGIPIWGVVWLVERKWSNQTKGALRIISAGLFMALFILVYNAEDTGINNAIDFFPTRITYDDSISYRTINMIGTSMQQYGIDDGDIFRVNHYWACKPGDNCFFKCLVPKCAGDYGDSKGQTDWTKRLISIKDDCYWFEGNPEPWMENGILVQSFDSRIYGCLKRSEFIMRGVAEPMGDMNNNL